MPLTSPQPCINHGPNVVVRQHCPDAGSSCNLGLSVATRCHMACYCKRCDHQWVEPCHEHQVAA
jgi:hypothetical protein